MEKLRGTSLDLVIIDEGKSFPPHIIDELVRDVLEPALGDRMGTLVLMGTPGAILSGEFYNATSPDIPAKTGERKPPVRPWDRRHEWKGPFAYSFHRWNTQDNTTTAGKNSWKKALQTKKAWGWTDENPTWRREYLGQWVANENILVYRYNPDKNTYDHLPDLPDGEEWTYVMGIDLGFEDDCAIVISAFHEHDPHLYEVETWKSQHLTVRPLAEQIKKFQDVYQPHAIVADYGGLGKMLGETLAQEYEIPVVAAEKKEKFDHIELLNSDLFDGRVKVRMHSLLAEEWAGLQWEDERKLREHSGCPNHASDAFLYQWRYVYHHFWQTRKEVPKFGTDAWRSWFEEEELKQILNPQTAVQDEWDPIWDQADEDWL